MNCGETSQEHIYSQRGTTASPRYNHSGSEIITTHRRCTNNPCLRNALVTGMRTGSYLKEEREALTRLRPCKSHEDVGAPSQKSLEVELRNFHVSPTRCPHPVHHACVELLTAAIQLRTLATAVCSSEALAYSLVLNYYYSVVLLSVVYMSTRLCTLRGGRCFTAEEFRRRVSPRSGCNQHRQENQKCPSRTHSARPTDHYSSTYLH